MALTDKLTAIADAIREKTGKTYGLTLDVMPGEIEAIQSGVELPELSNPGAASDLAQGKQFIDGNGNVIEGTIPVVEDDARYFAFDIWDSDTTVQDEEHLAEYPDCVQIYGNILNEMLIRKYSGMYAYVPKEVFGDAQPSDVAKGKTFTASGGVIAEGTMEAESGVGLPAGITEIQTGSWTQATNDSSGSFTIPHGCSKTPRFVLVNSDYATSGASSSNAIQITASVCADTGGFADAGQFGSGYGQGANAGTTNVQWDDTNLTFIHMNSRRWRQGNTYTWYAICVDNWEGV